MPVLKMDSGHDSARLAYYLARDRDGNDRVAGFATNLDRADSVLAAEKEFHAVRETFHKTGGVHFYQAYISFEHSDMGILRNADGTLNWDRIAHYGQEFAERAGIAERHQYYVVAHNDKANPHIHVVWNATSFEDGRKYHADARAHLDRLSEISNQLARERGIQRELSRDRNNKRAPDGVLRAAERGASKYSWKMDLQKRIDHAAQRSTSEAQFIEHLKDMRVEVRQRGAGYSYSFHDEQHFQRVARAGRLSEASRRDTLLARFEENDRRLRLDREFFASDRATKAMDTPLNWKAELRQHITAASRRATNEEHYRALLQRRGVSLQRDAQGQPVYSFIDSGAGRRERIPAASLGRAGDSSRLEQRFTENALRREVAARVGTSIRRARSEEEFRAQLQARGITLDRDGERYLYHVTTQQGERAYYGEALSRRLATDAVQLRYPENAERHRMFQLMAQAHTGAADRQHYLDRLEERGITYQRPAGGEPTFTFEGHSHAAGSFGKWDPAQAAFAPQDWTRQLQRLTRDTTGLAERLASIVYAESRLGRGLEDEPPAGPRRKRDRVAPGFESEETFEQDS